MAFIVFMDESTKATYITAIIGFIGVMVGGYISYHVTNAFYKKQQSDELKDNAKAIDISLTKFDDSEFQHLATLYEDKKSNLNVKMNPMNPLYSPNDINFLFKYEI